MEPRCGTQTYLTKIIWINCVNKDFLNWTEIMWLALKNPVQKKLRFKIWTVFEPVSYTHLDVYKRQGNRLERMWKPAPLDAGRYHGLIALVQTTRLTGGYDLVDGFDRMWAEQSPAPTDGVRKSSKFFEKKKKTPIFGRSFKKYCVFLWIITKFIKSF